MWAQRYESSRQYRPHALCFDRILDRKAAPTEPRVERWELRWRLVAEEDVGVYGTEICEVGLGDPLLRPVAPAWFSVRTIYRTCAAQNGH